MNKSKVDEFFTPPVDERIHIIGCGSVGSHIAVWLARCGCTKITLWDFDDVEAKNIANQAFEDAQIGMKKVNALKDLICRINPDAEEDVRVKPKGWNGGSLSGYVFLAVDSIELRREIVEKNIDNQYIKAMFDCRTGLTDCQHYAADWSDRKQKENLLATMQFSHEDAAADTPVSACGVTLGVVTTVAAVSMYAVANYINFIRTGELKRIAIVDLNDIGNIYAY